MKERLGKKTPTPAKNPISVEVPVMSEKRTINICIDSTAWKESVQFLHARAFFMKWGGDCPTFSKVRKWVDEEWGSQFEIKTLTNGFFLIIVGSEGEKNKLMNNGPFMMMGIGFYIKDWTPNFDPRQATIEEIPVWIRLYNLPHEYWKEEVFKVIGDELGRFIKSDEAIDKLDSCIYARVCIMWKPHPGLPKAVEIRSLEGLWRQEIEVEEIMVKCKSCKEWGHEEPNCKASQKGKGRADRALEDQLLATMEGAKEVSDILIIESVPVFDMAERLDGILRHSVVDRGGVEASLASKKVKEDKLVDQAKAFVPTVGEVVANGNGSLGETSLDHFLILAGSVYGSLAISASREELWGDRCPMDGLTTEVGPVIIPHVGVVGGRIPS
ncbi:uncharacterized protein LOC131866352 [Cryptomeria japonica]|uniref:uncharacterized protein LOC131866352 n=1 Tax=Cryptomeria japonica TaxID=3369 RepID=UPI0027DA698F|nr:uncharacterized protein LOC131866352 [Cryptomeria japonica]